MNKLIGKRILFIPVCLTRSENGRPAEERQQPIVGVIDYVHGKHGWFAVAYPVGGRMMHECFKSCDIGKVVALVGRKKNVHAKNHRQ